MAEPPAESARRGRPRAGDVAAFAVAYYLLGRLGLLFALGTTFVSAVWPPAGLTLAAALHLGRAAWAIIWVVAFLAGSLLPAAVHVEPATAALVAAVTAAGSTLRAVLGAYVLRRAGGREPSLTHVRTVAALVLGAGATACLVSASIGVGVRLLAGLVRPPEAWSAWLTWWLADVAGVAIVGPAVLLPLEPRRHKSPPRTLEAALLAACVLLVAGVVVFRPLGAEASRAVYPLLVPLVVWPAFRLSPTAASLVAAAVAAVAIWATAHARSFLPWADPAAHLLFVQLFLIVLAATGLALAAAVEEGRRASRRLQETTSLLQAVTEGTPDVVFVKDREGRYLSINRAGAGYMERSVEEVIGRKDEELFSGDLLRQIRLYDSMVLQTGEVRTDEYAEVKQGTRRTFLATKGPVKDAQGETIGIFGISREITNRKLERMLLNGILEGTPDLVSAVDLDFRFVAFNQALQEEYRRGFGVELVQGEKLTDLLAGHPEALARRVEALKSAFRGEETRVTWPLGREAPEARWYDVLASPIRDETGHVIGGALIGRDVTKAKAAEAALRESQSRLRALTEALAAANRELESFSYSVSHDLRAPLRGIEGFSRALEEDYAAELPEEARGYIERIRKATHRMGQIIDDLLLLSRVARSEVRRERVDLSALAREVEASLRAAERGREVTFRVAEGLQAEADGRLVRLLLENLLSNAWKYTSKRSHAQVELGRAEEEGEPAFFVRDDGAGFDMAYAHQLFGAFQRLHPASEFPGSGIGLATVARIAALHGGRVWARAVAGKGATFFFTLSPREGA